MAGGGVLSSYALLLFVSGGHPGIAILQVCCCKVSGLKVLGAACPVPLCARTLAHLLHSHHILAPDRKAVFSSLRTARLDEGREHRQAVHFLPI